MSFFMVKGGELRRMRVTRFVFSGPVDIVVEGVAKDIVGSFRKAILAALAVKEGKVMSSDALIDVVWAGSSPPTVTNTLQSHISFLRRAFESMGGVLRRSNFCRRIWRSACDGQPEAEEPVAPILQGAVFHRLSHHHKTILDELDVPDVLACERMGHRMKGISGRYSHVTEVMRTRLVKGLQRYWARMRKAAG